MRNLILFIVLIIAFSKCTAFSRETRIKIGVIDTGISREQSLSEFLCQNGRIGDGYDERGHGTNIFGLISENINPKTHCIISYKVDMSGDSLNFYSYVKHISRSIDDGVSFLNMSIQGMYMDEDELEALKEVTRNAVVIVSSGNYKSNLNEECNVFPACYKKIIRKNFIVVGSNTGEYSNYGDIVDYREDGSYKGIGSLTGTSQSAAIFTGKYASGKKVGF